MVRLIDPAAFERARIHFANFQAARSRFLPNRSSSLPVDRHYPSAASAVEGAFPEDR